MTEKLEYGVISSSFEEKHDPLYEVN